MAGETVRLSYEAMLRALLAHLGDGVHVVDRRGTTILYNPQAGKNDGLDPQEVIGRHLLEVFPSLDHQTSTILKVLETGQPILNQQQTFTNYKGMRVTTINSTWPIYDSGELVGAIEISRDVTRVRELSEQLADLRAELLLKQKGRPGGRSEARYTLEDLIGEHQGFRAVKDQALRAARGDSPVLVYGETGTGKELLVHGIHEASQRRTGPLVTQNCAALPEGLLEGILFGTTRGSFTGAEDRPGLFELADGGTLYLDEINSMDLSLQAKLLRVLQDGRVRRVGDVKEREVDVRVIASTNEDPLVAVRERRLRQDLYYRINVVYLELPPLRERASDIPLLVEHFIHKHRALTGARAHKLSSRVARFFQAYSWPGNVRELEHAIEAALQLASGDAIELEALPVHLQRAAASVIGEGPEEEAPEAEPEDLTEEKSPPRRVRVDPTRLRGTLAEVERETVQAALEECGWNISRTARRLGIPRQTLQYRMKVLGLRRQKRRGRK